MFNLRVEDLLAIGRRYMPAELSFETRQTLDSAEGKLSMAALISGTVDKPNVAGPTLHDEDIKVKDAEFQSLDGDFSRTDGKWDIKNLTLLGDPTPTAGVGRVGQGRYSLTGTIDEHADMDVSLDLTNIGLAELSTFVPWFTGKSGQANVFLSATGATKSPNIRGTVVARGMLAELDKNLLHDVAEAEAAGGLSEEQLAHFYDKTLSVNVPFVTVSDGSGDDKGIHLEGDYSYSGFKGTITAHAAFDMQHLAVPPNLPAGGQVTLQKRDLNGIAQLLEILDPIPLGRRAPWTVH
jgi:hypothetical protein